MNIFDQILHLNKWFLNQMNTAKNVDLYKPANGKVLWISVCIFPHFKYWTTESHILCDRWFWHSFKCRFMLLIDRYWWSRYRQDQRSFRLWNSELKNLNFYWVETFGIFQTLDSRLTIRFVRSDSWSLDIVGFHL